MSSRTFWVCWIVISTSITLLPVHIAAHSELNLAPDCTSARVTPLLIDPPDERMQPLTIEVSDPDGDQVRILAQCILQSEPAVYWSDGSGITGDAVGVGTSSPAVKAKRLTNFVLSDWYNYYRSNGRLYDVILKAEDEHGAGCTAKVTVEVPLYIGADQNPDGSTQDFGLRFISATNSSNCDARKVNNPPIIYSIAPVEATVGKLLEYQIQGHDPDSDVLSFILVSAPEGVAVDESTGLFTWTPAAEDIGTHAISVKVVDPGGLEQVQTFELNIQANIDVAVAIIANPTSGLSPLTVQFSPLVKNNHLVIAEYAWDFNGGGSYAHRDRFGAPVTHTYTGQPGTTFLATLKIVLGEGSQNPDGSIEIITTKVIALDNQNPFVTVSSTTTNGHVPLSVAFEVSAEDPQGIATVEIDYDGDGVFDDVFDGQSAVAVITTFTTTYRLEGLFVAVVKVTDAVGGVSIIRNNAIAVDVNNPLDPIVTITASPREGDVPLNANLAAEATLFDGGSVASWVWDLDGDGVFETTGGSSLVDSVAHQYKGLNFYYPSVKVTSSSGREATASIQVTTRSTAQPNLTIPDESDTINLDLMEMANFTVDMPYESPLYVTLEDASGAVVKVLSNGDLFEAGAQSLVWDGTDDGENFVGEGDYYVVLTYQAYGQLQKLDLRSTTGGTLTYYRRPETNPRYFNRLENPINIHYQVDDPAEVSFFWQKSLGDRLMTLLEHERMGRGSYSLLWNGEYPNGKKVGPDAVNLMPGILRYTLPSNVIFVKEEPRIIDFRLTSTIIADPRREPIGMEINISKDCDIELVVADMGKGVDVANRLFENLTAGAITLAWDGKNNSDQLLAPGDYRIGLRAIDPRGRRSMYWFRTQRINY